MDNIETLLQRFVDDRDQLADEELDALVEAVECDAALAARLKDQLIIDEFLAQRLAVDRRDFVAQVAQRIRDDRTLEQEPAPPGRNVAAEMRELLDVELAEHQRQAQRRRSGRWQWIAVAVALVLLAGTSFAWWRLWRRPLAVVVQLSGAPTLVRGSQSRRLNVGDELRAGDELSTLPRDEFTLRYADGSQLQIHPDTSLRLRGETAGDGKRIELAWGAIAADVTPQPAGRPMTFATPLAVATVRGTRLWLFGDDRRTRLDVVEGLVDLERKSDKQSMPVHSNEFALATADELSVQPLTWPVDRRDAIVILQTAETVSEVRSGAAGEYDPLELQPRGRARLDHDFALVLAGGAYGLQNASAAVLNSCRHTGELSVEATITPQYARRPAPAWIVACAAGPNDFNFILGQQADRLFARLRTSRGAPTEVGDEIELGTLVAGQPQHVALAYRSGELVCYLNGRRVYQDSRQQGDFDVWRRLPVTLGDAPHGERDWAGALQGLAIYDRFLPEDEVRRNAELFQQSMSRRPKVAQVEVQATLLEKSPPLNDAEIGQQRAALLVCRWRVDGVLRGELAGDKILVAHWERLDGRPQSIVTLKVGAARRMTLERLGLNAQTAAIPRSDQFSQGDDPQKPRYYEVSNP